MQGFGAAQAAAIWAALGPPSPLLTGSAEEVTIRCAFLTGAIAEGPLPPTYWDVTFSLTYWAIHRSAAAADPQWAATVPRLIALLQRAQSRPAALETWGALHYATVHYATAGQAARSPLLAVEGSARQQELLRLLTHALRPRFLRRGSDPGCMAVCARAVRDLGLRGGAVAHASTVPPGGAPEAARRCGGAAGRTTGRLGGARTAAAAASAGGCAGRGAAAYYHCRQ